MIRPVTLALAFVCAIPVVSFPMFSAPASATDDWDWTMGSSTPAARARAYYVKRHRRSPTKVMAFVKREDETANAKGKTEFHCVDQVRGVGTQWIGPEGALDTAKKDWMERVRYDYGESYLDMTNAKDFVSRCGRTSVGEVAGQVMYRCEIVARPCKAQMQQAKVTTK